MTDIQNLFIRQEQLTQQSHTRERCLLQPVRLLGQDWELSGRSALASHKISSLCPGLVE